VRLYLKKKKTHHKKGRWSGSGVGPEFKPQYCKKKKKKKNIYKYINIYIKKWGSQPPTKLPAGNLFLNPPPCCQNFNLVFGGLFKRIILIISAL
jgi:hypothetical protein